MGTNGRENHQKMRTEIKLPTEEGKIEEQEQKKLHKNLSTKEKTTVPMVRVKYGI